MNRSVLSSLLLLVSAGCQQRPVLEGANLAGLRELADAVDGDLLMEDVRELAAAHGSETPLDCRDFNFADRLCHLTHLDARALMRSKLEALGYEVSAFDTEDGLFSTSALIAEKRGTSRPDEVVLVGAHYDAFYQGADDNNSGVSGVLELARLFSGRAFDRTVRFVGFDLEELGLAGSIRYVASLPREERIVAALVFDCIGYSSTVPGSQMSVPGLPSRDTGDFLAVIANDVSLSRALEVRALVDELSLIPSLTLVAPGDGSAPLAGNLMHSDHAPFWLDGRPAVFMTDTAIFRNPHYHRDTDTPDTLDPAFLRGAVQVAAASLAYWAGGPR
ncbi:MAG TPA: M28 family peptidase [Myxococcaceae bacterium]|jgi:hypothetical protein